MKCRGNPESFHSSAQNKVVIVTTSQTQLLVIITDARADGGRRSEIQRRVFHCSNLAGGNQAWVRSGYPARAFKNRGFSGSIGTGS